MVQVLQEGAVAAGRFEHPTGIVAQAEHCPDNPLGGEHLAEGGKIG
jgi:hypothetical protein